jgi:nucleoside-diphosphate-sugar epimerase
MQKKVLVTGGFGFIGQALAEELLRAGYDTRISTRKLPSQQVDVGRVVVTGDLNRSTVWENALVGVHTVIHTAARVHVMKEAPGLEPLHEFRKVNTEGTERLVQQSINAGVKRFIFISSIKVNGEETRPGVPFGPETLPAPTDAYGISKLEAESIVRELSEAAGMEWVIVRPVMVYGPGVKGNFAQLMRAINIGLPLPLARVDNARSLVSLRNLVSFLKVCIEHPAAANQIFLVSDGKDLSTSDLIRRLAGAMNRPVRLFHVQRKILIRFGRLTGRAQKVQRLLSNLQVSITKNRDLLNWVPPFETEDDLRWTTSAFENRNTQ